MKIGQESAEINGTRMYYEIAGEGDCLCLIHGNTMDTRVWDAQFDFFSKHFRVLRYDLRGCGKSEEPREKYAFDKDLKALLDYLEIEKVAVCGISVGGGIAMQFTLNYPENVYVLIPVAPFVTGYPWPGNAPLLMKLGAHVRSGEADAAREVWNAMPWFDHVKMLPDVYAKLSQIVSENSGWFFERGHVVDWGDRPMTARLGEISVPTLILVGEHDSADNHEVVRILAESIENCQRLIVPDSGHMTMMENPDFFNEHVLAFLQSQ